MGAVAFESLPLRERIKLLLPYAKTDPEVARELAAVDAMLEANPLMGWEPAVSPRDGRNRQAEFLAARETFKLYAGGNGAGKSNVGTVDDLIQLCDESSLPGHLREFKRWEPPVPMRVVVPKMNVIEGATLEAFRALTPREQLHGGSFDKAYSQQARKLRFKNGSYVLFNTGDQDRDAHSAVELRRVRFDEEPEGEHGRGVFTENVARLRSCMPDAQISFTMTPLFGLSWVYDTIWERREDPDVFCVVASMRDNPYIDADSTIKALGHLSEEERQAVVEGRFIHISGTVVTLKDEHIVPAISSDWLREKMVYVGIDPGISRGGVVWAAFDNENAMVCFDELYPEGLTVPRIAAQIMVKNARWGIEPARDRGQAAAYFREMLRREEIPASEFETVMGALESNRAGMIRPLYVIDPGGGAREMTQSGSVSDQFLRAGIAAMAGNNDRRGGIMQLRSRLESMGLLVCENCVKLRWEAGRWLVATDEIIAEGKAKVKGAGGTFATLGPDHLWDPTRYIAQERLWYEPLRSRRSTAWSPLTVRPRPRRSCLPAVPLSTAPSALTRRLFCLFVFPGWISRRIAARSPSETRTPKVSSSARCSAGGIRQRLSASVTSVRSPASSATCTPTTTRPRRARTRRPAPRSTGSPLRSWTCARSSTRSTSSNPRASVPAGRPEGRPNRRRPHE
jgi:hypothetical protein